MLSQTLDSLKIQIDTIYISDKSVEILKQIINAQGSIQITEWVYIFLTALIAIAALGAFFASLLALKQTREYKQDENLSRRAWILPNDHPGYLDVNVKEDYSMFLDLKNYGTNPARNIRFNIYSIIQETIEAETLLVNQDQMGEICNPIAYNGMIRITQDYLQEDRNQRLFEKIFNLTPLYLYIFVEYEDVILNTQFKDSFFWVVRPNGKLYEGTLSEQKKVFEIVQEYLLKKEII